MANALRLFISKGPPAQIMSFQLSADEAVVSQDQAAQWLRVFTAFLENPQVLLSDHVTTPLEDY